MIEISISLKWVRLALFLISLSALSLGAFSAFAPQKSIAFYEWMMGKLNWRVEPIDQAREERTTRLLGILMLALAGTIMWLGLNFWSGSQQSANADYQLRQTDDKQRPSHERQRFKSNDYA